MKKFFLILFFICLISVMPAYTEQVEIDSEVISINPEHEFFIIKGGEDAGIEIGDGLIVHRSGGKIAGAHIVEVRPKVSAAEIINLEKGKEIKAGDNILIVKEIQETYEDKEEEPYTVAMVEEGDVISIEIDKAPNIVFGYANLVLKEAGFSISSSNRAAGIILASRPISLSLVSELWADAVAAIDHKFVVSLDIKSEAGYSRLMASAFKEHSQKNKFIKRSVTENTKYYNELMAILSRIKERSEY